MQMFAINHAYWEYLYNFEDHKALIKCIGDDFWLFYVSLNMLKIIDFFVV